MIVLAGGFAGLLVVVITLGVAVLHQRAESRLVRSTLRDFIVTTQGQVADHCNFDHNCEPVEILDNLAAMASRLDESR